MAEANVEQRLRVCTRCAVEMPATLEFFPPHRLGKYGLHSWCRGCKKVIDAERRARPDQKARQQAWRDSNKTYADSYNAEYRKTHKSTAAAAAWRLRNLELARRRANEAAKRLRREVVSVKLKERLRSRLSQMVRDKCNRRTEELLGFTRQEFARHIERQFTSGMSWAAIERGEIEIDHVLPVSMFKITSVDDPDFKVCWGLANLRPMWKSGNRSKGSKRTTLL